MGEYFFGVTEETSAPVQCASALFETGRLAKLCGQMSDIEYFSSVNIPFALTER